MFFRLVTIIYLSVLCHSPTHTSLFSTKYSISILLLKFSARRPRSSPPPPPGTCVHGLDLRYQETTEKTSWTIHEVVITVTEYDKYLICEFNFSPCQNDGFAAKTLIRAKTISQGTQYIQYPVLDAGVASGATLEIE